MLRITDVAWKHFGRTDPYWAVVTVPELRRENLTDEALAGFFASGERHVEQILATIRKNVDASFTPRRCLDFGCGVGRVAIPLARRCQTVVGVDVSEGMLEEARRNCVRFGIDNASFVLGDDTLTHVTGTFDLVHSYIVFQHITPSRAERLLRGLLARLSQPGMGIIHLLYSTPAARADAERGRWASWWKRLVSGPKAALWRLLVWAGWRQPEMAMTACNLNAFFTMLGEAGVRQCQMHFTHHGGNEGVLIFFRKQPGQAYFD